MGQVIDLAEYRFRKAGGWTTLTFPPPPHRFYGPGLAAIIEQLEENVRMSLLPTPSLLQSSRPVTQRKLGDVERAAARILDWYELHPQ